MPTPQWFEKRSWTTEDEADFRTRLKRCRTDYSKKHKLLTQAGILAGLGSKPSILDSEKVLDLYDELFPCVQDVTHERVLRLREQAWDLRAKNAVAYGSDDRAIYFFRKILNAEKPAHGLHTALTYGKFAIERNRPELYPEVFAAIDSYCSSGRLIFPFQIYLVAGIRAVILADMGKDRVAQVLARDALDAAGQNDSGLSRHPTVGLVGNIDTVLHQTIEAIAKGGASS